MKYFWIYLAVVSLASFCAMGIDKYKATHHKWRITERTLVLLAAIGGALGGCLGMLLFRHKTKHALFVWSFPILLAMWIVIVVLVCKLKLLT